MAASVVVVGGGITGLAAAHQLALDGADVTLVEAGERLGGKVRTSPFAGRPVDEGPDAFLLRVPWALDLCRELALTDQLVSPAVRTAYIWSRDDLRPLPAGQVLGVPTDLDALRASGVLDEAGAHRAARDLDADAEARAGEGSEAGDEAIGAMVRRRLCDDVLERLVDPLVGGINAGDTDRLSLAACAPQLDAAARADPSLIRALRAQRERATVDPETPIFATHPRGMGHVVDALAASLTGVDVRLDTELVELEPGPVLTVRRTGGTTGSLTPDAVVLTTPAPATARLLGGVDSASTDTLEAVEHVSVVVVTLAVDPADVHRPLDASGFLVPRTEGRLLTACSWASTKWAHLAGDDVVLRASAGRHGDRRAFELDDDDLVDRLLTDLEAMMGLHGAPTAVRVSRWPSGFPQYAPGHLDRVTTIERRLAATMPRVVLAGAAYRGVGLPACIRQGRQAATELARRLLQPTP
ncbi:protoporphyrinogen oxidase [soil metagenome]